MTNKNKSQKLLLFDIDGTLLSGRGVPKNVFLEVIRRRFPDYTDITDFRFSGLTDPQITQKLLPVHSRSGQYNDSLVAEILQEFIEELEKKVTPQNPPLILPGVNSILEICHQRKECFLGLVTGNMQCGAEIKLKACGLDHYFPIGAFGSDHEDRNLLPPLAVQRAQTYYGTTFSKENIWIIGDSIHDVRCAKANGMCSLAVASGMTSIKILTEEAPDFVIDDLTDTGHVLSIFGLFERIE